METITIDVKNAFYIFNFRKAFLTF